MFLMPSVGSLSKFNTWIIENFKIYTVHVSEMVNVLFKKSHLCLALVLIKISYTSTKHDYADAVSFHKETFYMLSGIMRLNKALDREKTPTLEVTVIAMDNVDPIKSSTATVSISVQDVNDNTPVFAVYKQSYKVKEDAVIGKVIATIQATDEDLGEFGKVVYSFDVSNDDDKLKINKLTVSDLICIFVFSIYTRN
jgi:hypothetical protein